MKLLQILLLFTIVLVIAAAGLFYMPKRTEAEPLTKPAAVPMCVRNMKLWAAVFICMGIVVIYFIVL